MLIRFFAFSFLSFVVGVNVYAASDPLAIQCAEKFREASKKMSDYKVNILKREWDLKGDLVHDEKLEAIVSRPKRLVQLKYMNSGATGIRNNGMTVTYTGVEKLKIELGSVRGFGFIAHGAAAAVIGDSMSMFDSMVLEDEIFTINRTGFDFLSMILGKGIEAARTSTEGGFSIKTPGTCEIKYSPHIQGQVQVTLQPSESLFDLEEKYGTMAYILFQENRSKFDSLRELFVRKKPVEISIPKSFYETHMKFNPTTFLLDEFQMFQNGRRIADYVFSELKPLP